MKQKPTNMDKPRNKPLSAKRTISEADYQRSGLSAKQTNLYHKVTKKEKQQIQKNAKKLLNEFSSKLSKIKTSEKHFENETSTREEGDGWNTDEEFRSITFSNAPFVDKDSIVAEKGNWKK